MGKDIFYTWNSLLPAVKRDKILLETHIDQKSVPMHNHAFLELTYIQQGTVEHILDGQKTVLRKGDYFIVDYGSRHCYRAIDDKGFNNLDCLFLPELLDPVLKGTESLRVLLEHYLLHFNMQVLHQNPAHMIFHDDNGKIRKLLEQIQYEIEKCEAGYAEMVRCYLIEILIFTMRRLDDAKAAANQKISDFLIAYVAEHYMEELTLQSLAAHLNYSLPYISKKFKEDVGLSFVRYLQNYRIMQSCRLLISSRRSVLEIAEAVGYRDVKFFSELFKRSTGASPSEFRRKHINDKLQNV